jgi:hypothetical protein
MTYWPITQHRANLRSSIVKVSTPNSATAGGRFMLVGATTSDYSIVDGRLRLLAGRSYYIEGSPLVQCAGRNGAISFQWYDVTNGQPIGTDAELNFNGSFASTARVGRRCANVLLTSSDVGGGVDVELRILSISGSSWNVTITSTGISTFNYVGYPSARILCIED